MTVEELTNLVKSEGVDKVNAALQSIGYRAFKLSPTPVAPAGTLSTGSIHLIDISGNSIPGHEVIVEPIMDRNTQGPALVEVVIDGSSAYPNVVHKAITLRTDEDGKVSVPLVKGSSIRVHVSQSNIFREVTVPQVDFNLLSPDIAVFTDSFSSPSIAPVLPIRGDI
jgi:hypothetical protein